MKSTLVQTISHPTDTHPPVSRRLEELGIKAETITKDMLLVPSDPAIKLIDNHQSIEQEITLLEHRLMVAYGIARPPEDNEKNQLLHASYSLAAAMVSADGHIDNREIAVAEEIGQKLFEDFDSVEFREYCNDPEQIPDIANLAVAMSEILENQQKDLVVKYLRTIAEADGIVSEEEELLLQKIAIGLSVSHSQNIAGRNSDT